MSKIMKKYKLHNHSGYSLFELVVVMIVISILLTVSMNYMGNSVDSSKTEETKEELNQLAQSIAGNDALISGSHRTDYGYIGDIGALPSSLNDLVTNPGFATWNGPYLNDDFYASSGALESEFSIDGWGKAYSYSGSAATISSTGGTTTITKKIANSVDDLLYNTVSFNIIDLDLCPPGTIDKDSVQFRFTYPNGLGIYQTDSKFPTAGGFVSFDSIPIGQQSLSVFELKNNDTLTRKIYVNQNSSFHADIQFPKSLWCDTTALAGGSGIETLRPNGTGSLSALTTNCANNWQCVDEAVSDDDGTYNSGSSNFWQYDLYAVENHTTGSGTIDSVKIFINAKLNFNNQRIRTYIRTNSTNYQGAQIKPSTIYTTYSTTYITNPQTSVAWTWTEIDAIEIGPQIRRAARVTQVWIEIYYTI